VKCIIVKFIGGDMTSSMRTEEEARKKIEDCLHKMINKDPYDIENVKRDGLEYIVVKKDETEKRIPRIPIEYLYSGDKETEALGEKQLMEALKDF